MSARAPGSVIERTKAATRPSSPRSDSSSSTTARYSRSRFRVRPSTGSSSGCGVTSTRRTPSGSLDAAPIWARSTPFSSAARAPPGSLIRSPTSTIGAHAGELVALARHQHDPLLVADVDGEGDRHVREDDRVVNRYQYECLHQLFLHPASCGSIPPSGGTGFRGDPSLSFVRV